MRGGSTMGYKLAGFNHFGGVEIDKSVAEVYQTNHNPKYLYNMDIREFNKLEDLPKELYNLDILDGSPPCSTFSLAGSREKAWGKEKQFREGQAKQTLDDLVFIYCETIIKLQPKVFLLENVKGIIQGNAKLYSKQIVEKMTKAGYNVQVFCLNAASMGVPQKRERVFFIGHQKEYNLPKLKMEFIEPIITTERIMDLSDRNGSLTELELQYWNKAKEGDAVGKFQSNKKYKKNDVANTVVSGSLYYAYHYPRVVNNREYCQIGTYPIDYNFKDIEPKYLIGMSVPPVMTAQIANQIRIQWLDKIII